MQSIQARSRSLGEQAIICLQKKLCILMLTLEQIESAILQLPPDEYQKLIEWFANLDYQRWDEQLEKDIADGTLEAFAQEAIAEFEAGNCRAI